ncbi:hypothetical protein [Phenylobacterium sp.]|uniref:hypothetical protein n=1 Tax=Phenylobacterium sp. TaxID=1871053 RepID=UPI0025DBEBB9|nr:hypothetical protein [Phenylobacterium sp.]
MDGSVEGQQVADASDEPFRPEAFAAIRAHPAFREVVTQLARDHLAEYGAASPAERWLTSDLGRAALTGAAFALEAIMGGFTTAQLVQAALANRTCSEGRARLYLRRARANGFLDVDARGVHRASERMDGVLRRGLETMLRATARCDPRLEPALQRLADRSFRRGVALHLGLNTAARPDLFNGPDKPVVLFLGRDGGARLLEQLIVAQPAGGDRLLESAPLSQRALAQGAFVSRTHVARLLADGEAQGLLRTDGRRLVAAPALAEDVERHYALVLEMARVSAHAALADGGA